MTALTPADLDNLTALAETATAGPWEAWQAIATAEFNISQRGREYFGLIATPARGRDDYGRADAAFIAAADPPTVAALVAALREARALVAAGLALADDWERLSRLNAFNDGFRFHLSERAHDLRAAITDQSTEETT